MTFGEALEQAIVGRKIQRAGWNGKGMWVGYQPGYTQDCDAGFPPGAIGLRAAEVRDSMTETQVVVLPHLVLRTADGSLCIGWLASQTDMLAVDWEVLD